MDKKLLYFQPQYVDEFICDGAKCPNNCCKRDWNIDVDAATYEKYSRLKPELKNFFEYDAAKGKFLLRQHPCPFLTEKNLCGLQLEFGEEFLSLTCATYPRRDFLFGNFFERSLYLSCPLAAEKILFRNAPISFELVEVTKKIHGDEKFLVGEMHVPENLFDRVIEIQIAMISILQERTLSIDQRLIVLGFFLDRLDEIISDDKLDADALTKLIAVYESKSFLAEQVPRMLATVHFDSEKFLRTITELLAELYSSEKMVVLSQGKNFLTALRETLRSIGDSERLANALKIFSTRHATFEENFLVNEIFLNCYPWRHQDSLIKNFGVFVATYKIFELMTFSQPFDKKILTELAGWFVTPVDHQKWYRKIILRHLNGVKEIFPLMETFLAP